MSVTDAGGAGWVVELVGRGGVIVIGEVVDKYHSALEVMCILKLL